MIDNNIQCSKDKPNCGRIGATFGELLLDSSLIITTNNTQLYDIKLINCGNYIQIYYLKKSKIKKEKLDKENSIKYIDTDDLTNINNNSINSNNTNNKIELKNIMRSKLQCQRLAKTNSEEWKTFITLTIQENLTDIDKANKKLRYFIDKVQRVYKDFKYICIPEFQKRGAVHYHLLTNISINDEKLIYKQPGKEKFKHIKYWNEGYNKVDSLEKDIKKIVGYISKYMTKDIDNRLYNHRRYFYSRNLKKPSISYLNLSEIKHLEYYNKIVNNKSLIYSNTYINPYNQEFIEFNEFL